MLNILKNSSFLLIINPVSGRKQGNAKIDFIIHYFKNHNINLEVFCTEHKGHAREYLKNIDCKNRRFLPLYSNDVEIFDYRPGRYHNEPVLEKCTFK